MNIKKIIFLTLCFSASSCLMAFDSFFQKTENLVGEWGNLGLHKEWPDTDFTEEFEFFFWNPDGGSLAWYVIRVANTSGQTLPSSEQPQVYLHHGRGKKEYPLRKIEGSKARWILHTIDINELFRLPKFRAKHTNIINTNTRTLFVLSKHKRNGVVTEVFRELGSSVSVDNINEMLRELTLPKELIKMERVEKALRILQEESKPKQSLHDLLIEVKPHGVRSGFLPWPSE